MVGHHQIGGSLVWTNNWVLGYLGVGVVRGGVGFGDVYGLLGENVGGGGWGIKYGKKKWRESRKKNGEHLNHIGKDKIKNWVWMFNFWIYFGSKKSWSCICTQKKKKKEFYFGEQKGFRSSYLYFVPFKSQKFK